MRLFSGLGRRYGTCAGSTVHKYRGPQLTDDTGANSRPPKATLSHKSAASPGEMVPFPVLYFRPPNVQLQGVIGEARGNHTATCSETQILPNAVTHACGNIMSGEPTGDGPRRASQAGAYQRAFRGMAVRAACPVCWQADTCSPNCAPKARLVREYPQKAQWLLLYFVLRTNKGITLGVDRDAFCSGVDHRETLGSPVVTRRAGRTVNLSDVVVGLPVSPVQLQTLTGIAVLLEASRVLVPIRARHTDGRSTRPRWSRSPDEADVSRKNTTNPVFAIRDTK
jgi:hypothetical protein